MGLPNRCFRIEGIAQIDFSWKSFLVNFGMHFYRFLKALGTVFLVFLSLENKLENKAIFMKNRISSSGSGDADRAGIWAL